MLPEVEELPDKKQEEGHYPLGNFADQADEFINEVLEEQGEKEDQGKMMSSMLNQGFSTFNPSMIMDKLKRDYSLAENLYGKRFLSLLTGYNPGYLKNNIRVPEFQRELADNVEKNARKLRRDKIIENGKGITEKGLVLASLVLLKEEVDKLTGHRNLGENITPKKAMYGEKHNTRPFKKEDRYRDIALRKSIRKAIRRGHKELEFQDLEVHERKQKTSRSVVYCMDASGSMKGSKIEAAKKAGIALAFKATQRWDDVGVVIFSKDILGEAPPSRHFLPILTTLVQAKPAQETDLVNGLHHADSLFLKKHKSKHILLLTDALPTIGKEPEEETLKAVAAIVANDVTVSIIGFKLDDKGKDLAEKIARVGQGRFYSVKDPDKLDLIVLEDYDAF